MLLLKMANKTLLGWGLAGILLGNSAVAQESKERLEVKSRVCEGFPQTVITVDGQPKYTITNAGVPPVLIYIKDGKEVGREYTPKEKQFHPVCYERDRDPITIDFATGRSSPQSCHYASPTEKLGWKSYGSDLSADIRPEEVQVFQNGKNVSVKVRGKTINCNNK